MSNKDAPATLLHPKTQKLIHPKYPLLLASPPNQLIFHFPAMWRGFGTWNDRRGHTAGNFAPGPGPNTQSRRMVSAMKTEPGNSYRAVACMQYYSAPGIGFFVVFSLVCCGIFNACRSANAVMLPWPMPGFKIKLAPQACQFLCRTAHRAGLIRSHRFQCGYLLTSPFCWMILHAIGSNWLHIILVRTWVLSCLFLSSFQFTIP